MGFLYPVGLAGAGAAGFIGATLAQGPSSGDVTVSMPSAAQIGDLAVVVIGGASSITEAIVPPTGWQASVFDAGFLIGSATYTKLLTAGDLTGPVSFGAFSAQANLFVAAFAYRGAVAGVVRAITATPLNTDSITLGGITKRAQTVGLIAVSWHWDNGGAYDAVNLPSGFTERATKLDYASTRSVRIGDLLDTATYTNGSTFTFNGYGPTGFPLAIVIELVGPLSAGSVETLTTIPAMTSNTTPSGYSADQDGNVGTTPGWNAFDATSAVALGGTWFGADPAGDGSGAFPTWVERSYPAPVTLGAYRIHSNSLRSWDLLAYVDSHWVTVDRRRNADFTGAQTFNIARAQWLPATKHRLVVHAGISGRATIPEVFLLKGSE